jgi:hypothetical protein
MLPEAATNVWTMEIVPDEYFVYQLVREGTDRVLRVRFDLNQEVPTPPTPGAGKNSPEAPSGSQ